MFNVYEEIKKGNIIIEDLKWIPAENADAKIVEICNNHNERFGINDDEDDEMDKKINELRYLKKNKLIQRKNAREVRMELEAEYDDSDDDFYDYDYFAEPYNGEDLDGEYDEDDD